MVAKFRMDLFIVMKTLRDRQLVTGCKEGPFSGKSKLLGQKLAEKLIEILNEHRFYEESGIFLEDEVMDVKNDTAYDSDRESETENSSCDDPDI